MMMELNATQAPFFTLYGDGIVVFQRRLEVVPQPDADGVIHGIPWRTAKLNEDQIQELLEFAITQGGLGIARDAYPSQLTDLPSSVFTIRAGGLDKTVDVNGLNEATLEGPDAAARAAFLRLAQRLRDFDRGGTIDTDVYEPSAYRATLLARDPSAEEPRPWPWLSIKPTDFKDPDAAGGGAVPFPQRVVSPEEVAALGIKDTAGGLMNVILSGPDGKLYNLLLRPLLVEEKE